MINKDKLKEFYEQCGKLTLRKDFERLEDYRFHYVCIAKGFQIVEI